MTVYCEEEEVVVPAEEGEEEEGEKEEVSNGEEGEEEKGEEEEVAQVSLNEHEERRDERKKEKSVDKKVFFPFCALHACCASFRCLIRKGKTLERRSLQKSSLSNTTWEPIASQILVNNARN